MVRCQGPEYSVGRKRCRVSSVLGRKGRGEGGKEPISVSQLGLLSRARSARSVDVFAFAGEAVVVLGVDLLVTSVVVEVLVSAGKPVYGERLHLHVGSSCTTTEPVPRSAPCAPRAKYKDDSHQGKNLPSLLIFPGLFQPPPELDHTHNCHPLPALSPSATTCADDPILLPIHPVPQPYNHLWKANVVIVLLQPGTGT